VPSANGRILAWCVPGARLHIIRRGGHLFLLERSTEMAELVADFLVRPGARAR
jgi:poly(3-hydroxyoctanoate) depolymerase